MKVTKSIREYVEEEVTKAYNSKKNPYSEQAEIDRQKIKAFEEELKRQQKEAIEKFIVENELFEDGWSGIRPKTVSTQIPGFSNTFTQAMLDEKEWKTENQRAKNSKVREIIVSLELGANRQELMDMIANLLEDCK